MQDVPELARLALSGELDLAGVVTHVAPLEGVVDALERLRRGEGARTVLVIDRELAGRS
jgi:S-(hydroxymethyl)glutathione dehydrogenase/alcohol dehydrogenase